MRLTLVGPYTVDRCWGCIEGGLRPVQRVEWTDDTGTHGRFLCRHCLEAQRQAVLAAGGFVEVTRGRPATA